MIHSNLKHSPWCSLTTPLFIGKPLPCIILLYVVKLTDGLVVPVYKKKWANFKTSDFLQVLQYVPYMPFSIFFLSINRKLQTSGPFLGQKRNSCPSAKSDHYSIRWLLHSCTFLLLQICNIFTWYLPSFFSFQFPNLTPVPICIIFSPPNNVVLLISYLETGGGVTIFCNQTDRRSA